MNRIAPSIACFLILLGAVFAQPPAPQIDETWPTPGERRKPDLTITDPALGAIHQIAYTPDGRAVVAAGRGPIIKLFQARTGEQLTGELLQTLENERNDYAFAFRPDGALVSLLGNHKIVHWNVTSGTLIRTYQLRPDVIGTLRSAAFRPGGQPHIATRGAGSSSQADIWNYETGDLYRSYPLATGEANLMFSPDGQKLISQSRAQLLNYGAQTSDIIEIIDIDTGERIRTIKERDFGDVIPGNTFLLATTESGVKLMPYAVNEPARVFTAEPKGKRYTAVSVNAREDLIAAGAADGTIDVWDTTTTQHLCTNIAEGAVSQIAFVGNNQKLASAHADGVINYWTVPLPDVPAEILDRMKAALPAKATATPKKPRRILVFWRSDAILHKGGVPAVNRAIELMGQKTGAYEADFTRDYDAIHPDILKNYDALVMNSTSHLRIPESFKQPYLDFAKNGGGVVAVHAAIDTFKGWPEGAAVIGATFAGHPWNPRNTYAVKLEEPDHPLLRAFGGKDFKIQDEIYELGDPYTRADRRVLMSLDLTDPTTANPGSEPLHRPDRDHAVSYIKRHGQGRVFYCDFGHIAEPFTRPEVLQYYLDGIQYALGDLEVDDSSRK